MRQVVALTTVVTVALAAFGALNHLFAEHPDNFPGRSLPVDAANGVRRAVPQYRVTRLPSLEARAQGPFPMGRDVTRGGALHGAEPPLPVAGVRAATTTWPERAALAASLSVGMLPDFEPWGQAAAMRPLRQVPVTINVDVNSLIVDALRYSARVQAISDNVIVAESAIAREEAEFDVHAFMESKFVRTSLPTGSVLDAGFDIPRLREEDWYYRAGARRKNTLGGRLEIAQRIGARDSNSEFFFPENQGNARLTLSYSQPLLNGAGKAYNTSLILLADLDTRVAANHTVVELQDQLLEVTEAMWDLYAQRSALLQKQRHLERAETVLKRLERRRNLDSLDSQIARAGAAVAMRRTELIRADAAIRNAESRLRALVNSPDMLADRTSELVPCQAPSSRRVTVDLQDALVTALEHRAEIDAAAKEIEAARIRLDVARNELLPALDVVLETYVSGLRGDYGIGRSWVDQFGTGEPSYSAGLVLETPIYRRAAKANHQRRQVELRQLCSRFRAAIETVHSDVEIAVRDVETTFREVQASHASMMAARSDARYLQCRWESLPSDDRSASFLLEDLLDAQSRLAFAESAFVQAQVDYTLSIAHLNRATGTLLQHEQIELVRCCHDGVPTIHFEKMSTEMELVPSTCPNSPPLPSLPGDHEAGRGPEYSAPLLRM